MPTHGPKARMTLDNVVEGARPAGLLRKTRETRLADIEWTQAPRRVTSEALIATDTGRIIGPE